MNTVILLGNLTKDPEIRYFEETILTTFTIAINNGNKEPYFFDCKAWNKTAENIGEYFRKGSKILIQGELIQEKWKTDDGENRSKVLVNVNRFDFVTSKKSEETEEAKKKEIVKFAEEEIGEDILF